MFLLPVVWPAGADVLSLSLLAEFRESHVNGLVSFRVGGGGLAVPLAAGGGATAFAGGPGLFEGDSAGGDHGIDGRALVMLLSESVLPADSFSDGL